jgi:oligopeptide transport system substrate-binding protein
MTRAPLLLAPVLLAPMLLGLAGCGVGADDSVIDIAYIDDPGTIEARGLRLSPAGQHLRAATREGLVAFDASGEVVPAIAERWIVTDDGLSYIFRLRNSNWPGGEPITSQSVRDQLRRTIDRLQGTTLGLDLAPVAEVRAMAGRVVEVRLSGPMPGFLQLLAQPELSFERDGRGTGPMRAETQEGTIILTPLPPQDRGLPEIEGWADLVKTVRLRSLGAPQARAAFDAGEADLVLGGTLANLPLADTGALSRGTVRLDAALGLFGLEFAHTDGFFAEAGNREAVALAIDRDDLLQPFNIGGWVPTTRIVPPDLAEAERGTPTPERWAQVPIEDRQAEAARRVAEWEASSGAPLVLRFYLPPGPGSDLLFRQIGADLADAGIGLRRAERPAAADLVLKDRMARYGGSRWFLNQFHCRVARGPCSADADELVRAARGAATRQEQVELLARAESALHAENVFVPLGAPIRWSMVRSGIDEFQENRWNVHPLFPFARAPM